MASIRVHGSGDERSALAGERGGHIAVHHCDRRVGSFFYGVATLPDHQRRGYASEAILLVVRYYFQEWRYQKMNADFLL